MKEHRFCPWCAQPLADREQAGLLRKVCLAEGCGYVHYDNPLPVVAALVEHEGEIVLARNKGWPAGWFGLVTGFLEKGESPEEGALRELREELGLSGQIARLIGVYPFPQRHEIIIAYHVRAEGTVAIGDEIEAVKRVAPGKLRAWPFGTGLAVAQWLEWQKG